MTQPNTERQALRRKSAIQSAVFSTVVQLTATALLFWAHRNTDSAVVSMVLCFPAGLLAFWNKFSSR